MDPKKRMLLLVLFLAVFTIPASTGEWKIAVTKELDALVASCVVIPCSFTHPKGNLPSSRLQGIWYSQNNPNQHVYDEDAEEVWEKFRGRTKLLGTLGQNNCSLEIVKIKDSDHGPFCLQIGILGENPPHNPTESHKFVNDCVQFKIIANPREPTINQPKVAYENHVYTVTCVVAHTCPSHRPNLTWSRSEGEISEVHRELYTGYWEVQSILTFMPKDKDDHSQLTCTAWFAGELKASKTVTVYIKRKESYNYAIIPAVVGIGTAAIIGVVCLFILKKYRRRISELQNQDGSMWNRLSRLSRRTRSVSPGSSCSDQRTRHKKPKIRSVQKAPKPRFPSPERQQSEQNSNKEEPGDDDYINTADLQVYGNL